MNPYTLISLLLLALVILDALGDGFRFQGWQVVHHTMETLQIAGWIALWAFFDFNWHYIGMYIIGRIMLFDIVFNLVTGHKILYIGSSDIIGIGIRWFARQVKQNYMHFSFILKFLAALAWVAGIINQSVG